jgi:hypothetical protein
MYQEPQRSLARSGKLVWVAREVMKAESEEMLRRREGMARVVLRRVRRVE